jgi:sugar/nucleoside kinase (ribokinase family)
VGVDGEKGIAGKATRLAPSRFSLRACHRIRRNPGERRRRSGLRLDLVAIGNPLLDVLEATPDEVLDQLGLVKGSMTLIDLAQANAVQAIMRAPRFVSGGSVANSAVGVAELGGRAGFIGAVADDEVGHTYVENLRAAGVAFDPVYSETVAGDSLGTGRCMVLISEDAERTMGTYLGAASTLNVSGVPTAVRGTGGHRLARGVPLGCRCGQGGHAARRRHGARADGSVALSLSDSFCVSRTNVNSSTSWWTTSTSCWATKRRSPCSSGPALVPGAIDGR